MGCAVRWLSFVGVALAFGVGIWKHKRIAGGGKLILKNLIKTHTRVPARRGVALRARAQPRWRSRSTSSGVRAHAMHLETSVQHVDGARCTLLREGLQ